jgi:hypothetical protein
MLNQKTAQGLVIGLTVVMFIVALTIGVNALVKRNVEKRKNPVDLFEGTSIEVVTDPQTKVQYLRGTHWMIPRLNSDGTLVTAGQFAPVEKPQN